MLNDKKLYNIHNGDTVWVKYTVEGVCRAVQTKKLQSINVYQRFGNDRRVTVEPKDIVHIVRSNHNHAKSLRDKIVDIIISMSTKLTNR